MTMWRGVSELNITEYPLTTADWPDSWGSKPTAPYPAVVERAIWEAGYTAATINLAAEYTTGGKHWQWAIEEGGRLVMENDQLRTSLYQSEKAILALQRVIDEREIEAAGVEARGTA